MQYWLMKSEPDVYSIDDLKRDRTTLWEGVRNFMARNFMWRQMRVGDLVLFYHSNAKPPGIVGTAEITGAAVPDPTQFKKESPYFDPKSKTNNPKWHCVPVTYLQTFPRSVSLEDVKAQPKLKNMVLLHNSRLSVQPVTKAEYELILKLGSKDQGGPL